MIDHPRLRLLDDRPTAIERLRMPVSRVQWPPSSIQRIHLTPPLESQGIYPTRADAFVEVVEATRPIAVLGVDSGPRIALHELHHDGARTALVQPGNTKYHPIAIVPRDPRATRRHLMWRGPWASLCEPMMSSSYKTTRTACCLFVVAIGFLGHA